MAVSLETMFRTTMPTNWMATVGNTLLERGWPIVPLMPGQKWPARKLNGEWHGYKDWQKHCTRPTRPFELSIWAHWDGCGVGVACGSVVGVDIDCTDPEMAGKIEELARDTLGATPLLRVGRAPKRLLVYRSAKPFNKMASRQFRLLNEPGTSKPHRVEILATGQQFVAYAIHPDTGEPYRWPVESPEDVDLSDLPEVSELSVKVFLERLAGLVPAKCFLGTDRPPQRAELYGDGVHDPVGTLDAITDAMAWIPNHDVTYDEWVRIGLAAKAGAGDAAFQAWDAWSAKSGKYTTGEAAKERRRKTWNGFKPNGQLGAGTIYAMAMQHGWVCPPGLIMNGHVAEAVEAVPVGSIHLDAGVGPRPKIDGVGQRPKIDGTAGPDDHPEAHKSALEDPTAELVADAPGLLGSMVRWMTSTAIFPQPFLALAASLVCVATAAGRRYCGPNDIRTNIYVVAVANSGSGKEHQLGCINNLFSSAGIIDHLAGEEIASGAAIEGAVTTRAVQLFQVDEFGHFMRSVMNPKASTSHRRDVFTKLTRYTGSANRIVRGTEYANKKERARMDVHEPCVCLYGTTVPEPLWGAFGSGALADGSVARMLYFVTPCNHPPRQKPAGRVRDVPEALTVGLRRVVAQAGAESDFAFEAARAQALDPIRKPGLLNVWPTKEAEVVIDSLAAEDDAQRAKTEKSPYQAVYARWMEHILRIATIAAIARDPISPRIEPDDLGWARRLVDHCVTTLARESEERLADSEHEARLKRVLSVIRKAGGEIKHNVLTRMTQSMNGRERGDAIHSLLESGQIVKGSITLGSAPGRPAIAYRIGEVS